MRIAFSTSRGRHYAQIASAALLILVFGLFNYAGAASTDSAQNGRLVTIHDRGQERVILTHAQTIRDALKDAKIPIVDEDTVEPGLDEPLVATDYTVNIYRARPVIVVDGAIRQKIMTAAQTTQAIAESADIDLKDEDKVSLGQSENIVADGASVVLTIDRATAFTLNLYGTVKISYSHAKTVGEMLDKKRIELGKDDTLSVGRDTLLSEGMTISIWRNGVQTATVEEPIAFPIRKVQNVDQPAGYRKVQIPGQNGRKSVTYQVTMQNGREIKRVAIQSVVLEEPKEQVEEIGAKPGFSGSFAEALARLRSCEGSYTSNTGNGYYGAYQFDIQTWGGYQGYPNAAVAPPAVQDQKAWETYKRRGWQPWPSCSKKMGLQDIYR